MATEREELESLRGQIANLTPRQTLDLLRSQVEAQPIAPQITPEIQQPAQIQPSFDARQTLGEASRETFGVDLPDPLTAGVVSAGRGLAEIGRGVERLFVGPKGAEELKREAKEEAALFEPLEEEFPIATTIGRAVGQAVPMLPFGVGAGAIKALAPRIAASAGLGATEAGLIAGGIGADVSTQLEAAGVGGVVAGTIEALLPVFGRLGGGIIRKVTGKAATSPLFDAAGKPSQEFQKALDASGLSLDDLSDEAQRILSQAPPTAKPSEAARKAILEAEGITPTKAQVTRNAADFQAQQEAAKTSGRVREALEAQDAILTSRFNQAVLETGGQADTPTSTVTDALVDKATTLDQKISDLYRAAREVAPEAKNIRFERLTAKIKELGPSDRATGGAVRSVFGDLQAKGILNEKGKLVGSISVETAEDVRKLMNDLYDPGNSFRNGILRRLKDTLDDDVFSAAGEDVFKQGRKAKHEFEKELTRAKISKFDSRKANLVRDVLENKISPDTFTDDIVFSKKWRGGDLKQLKDYISTSDEGIKAFDDMRADTLTKIKEGAFIGAEDAAGNRALSRAALERQIKKIGPAKMNVLFKKEERDFIKRMLAVTKIREPVAGTAIGRGPSAQAIARLEKKLSDLPIVGNLVEFIDVDVQGRTALKAKPAALPRPVGRIEEGLRGVAAPIGAGLTVQEQE